MKVLQILKNNYVLAGILILGAFLRFYKLDFQSIWLDEIHTMIECNPKITYKESYDIAIFREQMPQLYFLLIKLLSSVFGHTTYIVRSFSAVIGILTIFSIYLLGKEINNKKTGLIAALFLSINYFHLWYSQEARPYSLFALMTILSFYRLTIFIKRSNLKTALLYGFFAALMIDTHFFGIFILVSQIIILFFFLFDIPKLERITFLKYSIVSGLTAFFFWLPSLNIFLLVMKIKSFWIQPPAIDVYTQLFKEFFGNAESILLIVFIVTLFYFIQIFNQKEESKRSYRQNPMFLSFVIVITWILVTLFIPLVRSYMDIPMIISRYFIGVLPAVILLLSMGISSIKSKLVQNSILFILLLTSLTDIIIVKDYYNKTSKTQFREITETILKRNKNKEKVVSSFGWLMSYFLNENATNTPLLSAAIGNDIAVESTLEGYIALMKNKTIPMESFWYMDGNSKPYKLSNEDESFIKENFVVRESIAKFDTWTRHYVSKTIMSNTNASSFTVRNFQPLNIDATGNVTMFENSTIKSPVIFLDKGKYELLIDAISLPQKPINGENAHLVVKLSEKIIANYYLSEKKETASKNIQFEIISGQHCRVSLTFDNDLSINNLDRNAIIYNVKLDKK